MQSVEGHRERTNNFGLLRLAFASLVIVSHSPELIDGDRHRELLSRWFGTLSFGELAVDGFFLISGFLITKSFASQASVVVYALHRVMRIVPGFLVSFWLCVLALGPFVGGLIWQRSTLLTNLKRSVELMWPDVPGAFVGLPNPLLNGALWTIAYEFRCYVAVAIIGLVVKRWPVRHGRWFLFISACLGFAVLATGLVPDSSRFEAVTGRYASSLRFFSVFAIGSCFYLFREKIIYRNDVALGCALALLLALRNEAIAEFALSTLGGYLVFWLAFKVRLSWFKGPDRLADARRGNEWDISYGIYLYGWPVQNALIYSFNGISPFAVALLSFAVVVPLATLSWVLIERPMNRLGRYLSAKVDRPA